MRRTHPASRTPVPNQPMGRRQACHHPLCEMRWTRPASWLPVPEEPATSAPKIAQHSAGSKCQQIEHQGPDLRRPAAARETADSRKRTGGPFDGPGEPNEANQDMRRLKRPATLSAEKLHSTPPGASASKLGHGAQICADSRRHAKLPNRGNGREGRAMGRAGLTRPARK